MRYHRGAPLSARALRRLVTKKRAGRYRSVQSAVSGGGFELSGATPAARRAMLAAAGAAGTITARVVRKENKR